MIVFNALDFRLPLDEERKLSRPLESLIEGMTSAYSCEDEEEESSQTADEGIEQDSGEDEDRDILSHQQQYQDGKGKRGMSLVQVMEVSSGRFFEYEYYLRILQYSHLSWMTFAKNLKETLKKLLIFKCIKLK